MTAARAGQVPVIRVLAAAGASLEIRDRRSTGWTALIHAIHKDRTEAVQALLAAGADANARCEGGTTPLMFAAAYGNTGIVRSLLDEGADPASLRREESRLSGTLSEEAACSTSPTALPSGRAIRKRSGCSWSAPGSRARAGDRDARREIAGRSKECSELISRIQPR